MWSVSPLPYIAGNVAAAEEFSQEKNALYTCVSCKMCSYIRLGSEVPSAEIFEKIFNQTFQCCQALGGK